MVASGDTRAIHTGSWCIRADVRAMRKLPGGNAAVVIMAECMQNAGNAGAQLFWDVRYLAKLA